MNRRQALALLAAAPALGVRFARAARQHVPAPLLATHRIVSFYGHPLAPVLGVLGEQQGEATVARLRAQADAYLPLSDDREIQPALHLIYAVAQASPGSDGLYLGRMSDALVERYVTLARDNGLLLFLDIQMGRSTVDTEFAHVAPFLAEDHVHLALDPEFAWGAGVTPVEDIGYLSAAQINRAQALLGEMAVSRALSGKVLIIHQFRPGMVREKAAVARFEGVEVVYDMDGFGPPAAKLATWERVIVQDGVANAGVKLFYRYDVPLMSPADVLALEPRPAVVIYQ